jgi:hypothetical protein
MSYQTIPPILRLVSKSWTVIAVLIILAYAAFNRSLSEIPRGIAALVCLGLLLSAWLTLRNSLTSRWRVYLSGFLFMLALATVWFGLNQLRVHWYDQGVEQGFSGYWYVVKAQDIIVWPFLVLLVILIGVAIYELSRWGARHISNLKQI